MSGDQQNLGKGHILDKQELFSGKWLSLQKIAYSDQSGKNRIWEAAERTTKSEKVAADAVAIIPILKRSLHFDSLVLVKQFRPPVAKFTVEFPAGLMDVDGEDPSETALRELKEETGYTGKILHISPATSLDPGLSSSTVSIVHVLIEGDDPINNRPKQQLDDGEFVEVLHIPMQGALEELQKMSEEENLLIDSRVYTYVFSLHSCHSSLYNNQVKLGK